MKENQFFVHKGSFLLTIVYVVTAVAAQTQELLESHDKLIDTGGSGTLLDEAKVFNDKEANATMAETRFKKSCTHASTASSGATPGLRSLVIVLDISGSMKIELEQLRLNARRIVDEITNTTDNPIFNYIFVPFTVPTIKPIVITRDKNEFVQALQNQGMIGGGCPEYIMEAIAKAIEAALPYSTIYVFTDADADTNPSLYSNVLRLVEEKQTPIVFFRTGTCTTKDSPGQKVIDNIAAASKGQVYDIQKTQIGQSFVSSTQKMLVTKLIPELSLDISNVELLEGDNLELNCYAKHLSSMVVQWKQLDRLLEEQKFELSGTLQLKIDNVTTEHSGSYVCRTDNCDGEWQKVAEVHIKKPVISVNPKDNVAIEQTELVSLQCTTQNVKPEARKVWTHNGAEIESAKDSEYLQLYNLTSVDEESPKITKSSRKTIYVPSGGRAVLHCSCSLCRPLTDYIWTNGRLRFDNSSNDVQNNTRVNLTMEQTRNAIQYNLTIDDFGSADEGNYSCILSNAHGSDSFMQEVLLIKEPQVKLILVDDEPREEEFFGLADSMYNLTCIGEGVPEPEISWLVDGKAVDNRSRYEHQNDNKTLTLVEAFDMDYSGVNKCIASNFYGRDEVEIYMQVRKPVISVIPKNIVDIEHAELISLQCSTENVKPGASKVWTHNGAKIESAKDSEYLQLYNLTSVDEGIYECQVEINGRFISDFTSLTIETAPKVLLNANDNVSSPYGKPLTLDCGINGKPKPMISWSYRSLGASEEKTLSNSETSLQLPSVTPEAEGFYICEGSNSHGKAQRSILMLGEANGPPKINKPLRKTIYVPSGGRAVLHCSCSLCRPLTNYMWTNGFLKFNNSSYEVQSNAQVILTVDQIRNAIQYNLTIDDFSSNDEGNYSCTLSNAHGSDGFVVQVALIKEPKVNAISIDDKPRKEDFVGLAASVHNLTCNAEGVPEPQITWLVDGKPVKNSSRYELQNDNKTLTLVDGFDIDYSGVYKCIASSLYGRDDAEIVLKYGMFPQLTHIPRSAVNEEVGHLLEIPCEAEGIPEPDVTWFFNGQPLGKNFPFEATLEDSGIYECVANNTYGHIAVNSTVVIFAKPELILQSSENMTIAVSVDNDVTLECIVTGFPTPTVSWTFENRSIDEVSNVLRTPTGIKISKMSTSNLGAYVCNAKNLGGVVQKLYHLFVEDPPKIITSTTPKNEVLFNRRHTGLFVTSFGQVLGIPEAHSSNTPEHWYLERYPYADVRREFPMLVHVPARWSPWSEWSGCSVTCGTGFQLRSRVCLPASGSSAYEYQNNCVGESYQVKNCDMIQCPTNGGWGSWSDWSNCSRDCVNDYTAGEKSTRSRSRKCDSSAPSYGGKPCIGERYEEEACSVPLCRIDGGWTPWTPWSPCSEACGFGKTIRWRTCANPALRNGGLPCQGSEAEIEVCKKQECIVDGGWSDWGPWSQCIISSGTKVRIRTRSCINPKPKNGGHSCVGQYLEEEQCNINK